jgi:SAM-dependent methyltransferase/methyltransferase-like protein
VNDISIYDEVSFPSYPHALSHPQRLATIARLRGLVSPPIEQCRVLELGCGAGGNLIPVAETMPASKFLGVDLSQQQIEIASQQVSAIAIPNIDFLAVDFIDLDESIGEFDYIICHGVYSWTTDPGRAKILELCRQRLSPTGVAYINFNTFPGWHVQGMLRDMLRFHCQRFADPQQRVREARNMIQFLLAELRVPTTASTSLLRDELAQLNGYSDAYLFHAYLNVVNQPFYLHEVIQRAKAEGLQYVGDADAQAMWPEAVSSSQSADGIRNLASAGEQTEVSSPPPTTGPMIHSDAATQQYYDFIRFSMSRRSVLCHDAISLRSMAMADAIEEMNLAAHLRVHDAAPQQPAGTIFITADRQKFAVTDSRLTHVLNLLANAWPESRPWKWLRAEVDRQVNPSEIPGSGNDWLMDLFRLFARDLVQWSVRPGLATRSISSHPRVTAFARRQAAAKGLVTNLRHHSVNPNPLDRQVLQYLDGSRSQQEIATATSQPLASVQQTLTRLVEFSLLMP